MGDSIKFEAGNLCMVTGGRNTGRVGTIMHRERHPGSFDIVHVKDAAGHTFATRMGYIFVIGRAASLTSVYPRARVSNSPLQKNVTSVLKLPKMFFLKKKISQKKKKKKKKKKK